MNTLRRRCATARLVCTVGILAATAGIAGCATPATPANAAPDAAETTIATPLSTPVTPDPAVTDVKSCEVFSDVLTILHNAMSGLHDERMTQQEVNGWLQLATRVLDRIPTTGEGAVSDGIAALKAAAPATPSGTSPLGTSGTPIGTPEWYNAATLNDACNAAGYQITVQAFTGG